MIDGLVLQGGVCDPATNGWEYLADFEFIKAFTCTYANAAGMLVVGLLVYGGISLSIYIRTGSAMLPVILLLLIGGAVTSQLAPPAIAVATITLLLAGAAVMAVLYYRYSR